MSSWTKTAILTKKTIVLFEFPLYMKSTLEKDYKVLDKRIGWHNKYIHNSTLYRESIGSVLILKEVFSPIISVMYYMTKNSSGVDIPPLMSGAVVDFSDKKDHTNDDIYWAIGHAIQSLFETQKLLSGCEIMRETYVNLGAYTDWQKLIFDDVDTSN